MDRALFINFVTQVSPACDCYGYNDFPIVGDIGILAGTAPVALDQACADLVIQAPGLPGSELKNLAPGVDKFKDIEGKYMKNIDEWVCNLYFEMRDIKLVECAGHKEFMEFPIPSEIQAFLEGKISEKQLNEIIEKKQKQLEGQEVSSESEEEEKENPEENSRSQNLEDGEVGKLVNGEFILNGSQEKSHASDSDEDGLSIYDVEGKDDIIPNLRETDLRDYKYAIEKKLLFENDDEEELKKIRYIFKELLLDIGIGRFGF